MTVGRTLGGRYRLSKRLGRGSFGVVWQADELLAGEPVATVAVKVFTAEVDRREVALLAGISHPSVLAYRAVVEEDGEVCLVTELADGGDAAALLREWPDGLPSDKVREIVRSVGSALAHLHERGWVHRDVKPANILFVQGAPKLGDVGTARALAGTATSTSTASLAYAAPEMFSGRFGPGVDVYALACTVYELLTARLPFEGSMTELVHKHLTEEIAFPADMPGPYVEMIRACTAKDPDHRWTVERLLRWADDHDPAASSARVEPPGVEAARPTPSSKAAPEAAGPAPDAAEAPPATSPEDLDVHVELPITASQAQGGETVSLSLDDGEVRITVPAGVRDGQKLRLKGRGVEHGGQRGDLYVEVRVATPKPGPAAGTTARPKATRTPRPTPLDPTLRRHLRLHGERWSEAEAWRTFMQAAGATAREHDLSERDLIRRASQLLPEVNAARLTEQETWARVGAWVAALGGRRWSALDWADFLDEINASNEAELGQLRDALIARLYPAGAGATRILTLGNGVQHTLVYSPIDKLYRPTTKLFDALGAQKNRLAGVWFSAQPITVAQWSAITGQQAPPGLKPDSSALAPSGLAGVTLAALHRRFPLEEFRWPTMFEYDGIKWQREQAAAKAGGRANQQLTRQARTKAAGRRPKTLGGLVAQTVGKAALNMVKDANEAWLSDSGSAAPKNKNLAMNLVSPVPKVS